MKKDWTYKKLGDCLSYIKNGANIKQTRGAGGIPITRIETLSGGVFNHDRLGFADITDTKKYENFYLETGDLLMSHINSKTYIGRTVMYNQEGNEKIIHGMNLLRLKVIKELIYPSFFCYYAKSNRFKDDIVKIRKDAVNQSSICISDIVQISIPIPPLVDQELIVRELDAIHGILDKKQEQLRLLDHLAQAIFYDVFGDPITNPKQWEVKKLGEVGENGLTYGSGASAVDFDGKVRYVRITDIREDGTLNDNIMSPNSIEDKYLLNEGDLLFARSGATVGKTYLHVKNDMDYIYAGYLIRLIPNKEIVNPLYLFHITKTQYYLEFIKSTQSAVAQPNINAKQYGDFSIPLPPLSLQQSFAAKIEAIEAQKQAVQQSIREVEALLAERMDYYFS